MKHVVYDNQVSVRQEKESRSRELVFPEEIYFAIYGDEVFKADESCKELA